MRHKKGAPQPMDDQEWIDQFRECSFLDVLYTPVEDARTKLRLMWVWLLVALCDWLEPYFRRSEESSFAARAVRVRKLARALNFPEFGSFPEILVEGRVCEVCDKLSFIVVHPSMTCDQCWLEFATVLCQFVRDLKSGMSFEEAQRLADERAEEITLALCPQTTSA